MKIGRIVEKRRNTRCFCKPKVAGSIPVSSTINQTPYFPERGDGLLLPFCCVLDLTKTDAVSGNNQRLTMRRIPKLCRQKLRNRAFVRHDGKKIYLGKWGPLQNEANYRAFINDIIPCFSTPERYPAYYRRSCPCFFNC